MSDDPNKPTLDYQRPADLRGVSYVLQCFGTTILVAILLMGLVFFWGLMAFSISGSGSGGQWFGIATPIVGVGLLALLIWWSTRLYSNPRRRGYAFGMWLGIGIAGLVAGLCFGAIG